MNEEWTKENRLGLQERVRSWGRNKQKLAEYVTQYIDTLISHHDQQLISEIEGMKRHYHAWFRRWGKLPDGCADDPNKLENFLEDIDNSGHDAALSAVQERLKETK